MSIILARLLADSSPDLFRPALRLAGSHSDIAGLCLPVDVVQEESALRLTASVPGLKADDLNLTLKDDLLTISGEFKRDAESGSNRAVLSERCFGRFSRSFRLPFRPDAGSVQARLLDGVLTVMIPIDDKDRAHTIPVVAQ